MEIPGLGKLKDMVHVNEVVAGVPTLVLKAVALHALVLRGVSPAEALSQVIGSKNAIADLAKD